MAIRKSFSLLGAVALIFLVAGLAQAAEFSALCLTKTAGRELPGKIFVKGDKVRLEATTPLGPTVSILRLDKQVMWMLLPGLKSYMEMPFDQKAFAKALHLPDAGGSKRLVGTETVNGYETEKYETSGDEGKSTIWIAKKLGVPIRFERADKSVTQDYRDIKVGGVNSSLFEIPAGFQKMGMPAGLPKMK